jgi:hypothetical protein
LSAGSVQNALLPLLHVSQFSHLQKKKKPTQKQNNKNKKKNKSEQT